MCEPTTIALVAGMVITAYAGYEESQAQEAAGKANQQIAENNARLADQQAKDTQILSARESQEAVWRKRAQVGAQTAALAANGIDSGLGSAYDILGETSLFGGAEQSAIAQGAARKAWGFQSEALNFRNQGAQANWMGKTQSRITILKTLGSMASMAGGYGGGGGAAAGSRTATASSGMSYTAPATASGASWMNAYGYRP